MEVMICGDCEIVTENLDLHSKLFHNGILVSGSVLFRPSVFNVSKSNRKRERKTKDSGSSIEWGAD